MNALILVDIQNDFLPGGALAVPDGDGVIPVANRLIDSEQFTCVVATQDWHPHDHGSFAANHPGTNIGQVIELNGLPQILWPVHCVQKTSGADFPADLNVGRFEEVFPKGTDPAIDSYSGFFDNGHRKSTRLGEYLRELGMTSVYVCGLAIDYCVKFTALDATQLGFETTLIQDASRGVNLRHGDVDRAVEEMRTAGVRIATCEELLE
jgi:nicotinamidase/pyrazinamidase